jgi:hypothetical protein
MRFPSLLLALTLGCTSVSASGVQVVRILPEYMPADSFVRISEYFSGKENTRGATILRTQPKARDGFYFNLRTQTDAPIELVWVVLEIITPASAETRIESFAVSLPKGSHLIRLGLTGKDWPNAKDRPAAWKLRLLGVNGAELASEQSYLWSKPDAPTPAKPADSTAAKVD